MVSGWAVTHIGIDLAQDARRNAGNAQSLGIVAKYTGVGWSVGGKVMSSVNIYLFALPPD
jgi:hypothetical protein